MNILMIAAFSDGETGGNPAGVVVGETLPPAEVMQATARYVGFSETVFAAPDGGDDCWRARYFSPESEVPFCGHATIALGAALAEMKGAGTYRLKLNAADISVEGRAHGTLMSAALQSPPTQSVALDDAEVDATLALFGYNCAQLDASLPPARIHGGADHYVLALRSRSDLAAMRYDLDAGRDFMRARGLVTIMLVHRQADRLFSVRNAFASGGVLEDPATGAAAAAFAGYLRDAGWPHGGRIDIIQGEDMGARSLITAEFGAEPDPHFGNGEEIIMMPMRMIISTVFLLCAVHAARALGLDSIYLDAVNKLPVELSLVKNCGNWEADGKRGDYRMIVADVYNGVGNELYVQWIEMKKDSSRRLLTTLAFPELNNDHAQYAFESVSCGQKGKRVSIEIKASFEHDENGEVHDISIELIDVGKYRLADKIRKR